MAEDIQNYISTQNTKQYNVRLYKSNKNVVDVRSQSLNKRMGELYWLWPLRSDGSQSSKHIHQEIKSRLNSENACYCF
jgi:hypothetical protein